MKKAKRKAPSREPSFFALCKQSSYQKDNLLDFLDDEDDIEIAVIGGEGDLVVLGVGTAGGHGNGVDGLAILLVVLGDGVDGLIADVVLLASNDNIVVGDSADILNTVNDDTGLGLIIQIDNIAILEIVEEDIALASSGQSIRRSWRSSTANGKAGSAR